MGKINGGDSNVGSVMDLFKKKNEPEWTVTEHMDGTPMYIAPENRLRIW